MDKVNLGAFSTGNFDKGAGELKIITWYFINALLVRASWNPFMNIKIILLRAFGAKIGRGLVIKNNVTIKFPWKLTIGNNVWLGEQCWIDNLDYVPLVVMYVFHRELYYLRETMIIQILLCLIGMLLLHWKMGFGLVREW